jgi:hypothetical protein
MNDFFRMKNRVNREFEGYIPDFQIALLDALLSFQNNNQIEGDLLELGTYKGKTASILCWRKQSSYVYLVDKFFHFTTSEWEKLLDIDPKVNFIQGSTEEKGILRQLSKTRFRFSHCDTSHSYFDTSNDLGIAAKTLSKGGIICVDDFANLDYPGVLPAVYGFLFKNKRKFRIFLTSKQKVFICRLEDFEMYSLFCQEELLAQMTLRGETPYLSRTDSHYLSACTYIGEKNSQNEPDHYGGDEFLQLFKQK